MKKIAYIICEYNPFHNGHAYHIAQTRAAGAQTVVCIMSGNFVQRGALAFADKATRAKWAIQNGADLVFELPVPYVLSGAGWFASGAAKVIRAIAVPGTLSFGAGVTLEQLNDLIEIADSEAIQARIREVCAATHVTFPRAFETVLKEVFPQQDFCALRDPNAILALEYMRAVSSETSEIDFYSVRRETDRMHDAASVSGNYASAKYLRELFDGKPTEEATAAAAAYIPASVLQSLREEIYIGSLPLRQDLFSCAAMTRLLSIDAQTLKNTNGVVEGLENRILNEVIRCNQLQTLYDAVKTKRFTHARIRQIVVSAVLGITRRDLSLPLPYLRVLGMNGAGKAF